MSSSPVKNPDFRCFSLFLLLHYPHTPRLFPKGGRYGIRLADAPHLSQWFHEKRLIPLDAYLTSMEAYLAKTVPVPQWYLAMVGAAIVNRLGVIENDFHNRKDLTPNICAVYTEKHSGPLNCRHIASLCLPGYERKGGCPTVSTHEPCRFL